MNPVKEYLNNNKNLPTRHWTCEWSAEMLDEIENCNHDIFHFANNYFYIINVDEGRQTIKLYDCQKRVLQSMIDNRFTAVVASRQVGKSTLLTIFSLWLASFNKDQNIFILANKEETAKMILERVRMAYEEIPNWLKPPIKEFTKTALVFENGSAIRTSTTSVAGIRGQAVSCLLLDEFAFIRPEIAHEFYEGVAPTISSSRKAKVIMTSTPNSCTGKFYEIYSKAVRRGTKEWNGWTAEKIMWDEIPRYNLAGELDYEGFKSDQLALLGGDVNSWLQEYCCVFLESGASALTASVFEKMIKKCKLPKFTFDDGDYVVWEEPKPGHIYSIGVDTAEGVGLDYSVAQIMDITDLTNIVQVGQYHSNTIQPYVFAERLNKVARSWGRPFLCIERNGPGGQVIDALYEIHKYDNIVQYSMKNDARGVYQKLGIYCHTNSKYTGIMNMKYWVEHLQCVTIYDINTMKEYETFRRKDNGTWNAQDGFYDDRIMSMVWSLILIETEIAQKYLNILSYDDIGKPKIIKDPSGEFNDYLGIYGFTSGTSHLGDPSPSFLGVSPNEILKSASNPNEIDLESMLQSNKWSII